MAMFTGLESHEVTQFFVAVLILLFCARMFGHIFNRFNMPRVVGEIFGGLLLGPTVLGHFFPAIVQDVFVSQNDLLFSLYWLGLVLLMFTSGFEIQRKFDEADKKAIGALTVVTTALPLGFGWLSTYFFDLDQLIGPAHNEISLKIVIMVALGITSIPVLSKIFIDLNIMRTPFAKIVLATATIHDILLWVLVSIATGLVASQQISLQILWLQILISALFFVTALILIPHLLSFAKKKGWYVGPRGNESAFMTILLLLFIVAAAIMEVNVVFGAFLAGIVVNFMKNKYVEQAKLHIKEFSLALFVPIYFAMVGIQLDLIHNLDLAFFLTFLLFALLVQTLAVILGARILRYNWLSCANLAVALNNRGGPCIVLATLAFGLGIINENFFVTLILLAIITSLISGSWLRYVLNKKWPLLEKQVS